MMISYLEMPACRGSCPADRADGGTDRSEKSKDMEMGVPEACPEWRESERGKGVERWMGEAVS